MKINKIITLTLNPTWDIHIDDRENRNAILRRDTGGKGINVSRALQAVGISSTSVILLPADGAEEFTSALSKVLCGTVQVKGRGRVRETRHYLTENGEKCESLGGGAVDSELARELFLATAPLCGKGTLLIVSGSVAKHTDMNAVMEMILSFKKLGAAVVLDSTAFTTSEISVLQPFLVKPNKDEAESLCGVKIDTASDAVAAAKILRRNGAGRVLLSLGARGAVLITENGEWLCDGVRIEAMGTVGAGDAALAGYVTALCRGMSDGDGLALSCAFGSAACLSDGTSPPDPCRIKELFHRICEGR